jgi:mannan endo-1,6-alpha-mannosidase
LERIEGILNATLPTFFPKNMGGVMVEITCEPLGNCNNDQPAFKAFLARWLVLTAQLVPELYERIFVYLRKSASGAAGQCIGGALGRHCGREWNSTIWDGTSGVGEQMSALAAIQAMMMDTTSLPAPVRATTGGTSQGDPSAGTGSGSTVGNDGMPDVTDIITTIVLLLTLTTGWCLIYD